MNSDSLKEAKLGDFFVRPLLDKEIKTLKSFIDLVRNRAFVEDMEDRIVWAHNNTGEFSFKKLT